MPSAAPFNQDSPDSGEFKKLILCFDGTGNTFSGTNADTNVVKILRTFERNHPNQFHYYQTGIGTYDVNETSINKTILGEMRSSISKTIDLGFGTTFDAHIMAGYRFLMRYYETDAKIYIFGFSRGTFTAKYLARMINKVGLLCKGNEEMVPFAYRLYQSSLELESADRVKAQKKQQKSTGKKAGVYANGNHNDESCDERDPMLPKEDEAPEAHADGLLAGPAKVKKSKKTRIADKKVRAFGQAFCRNSGKSLDNHDNIQVFFLGIWDCVNSVAVVEKNAPAPVEVTGTAQHIRHAVAVDERRVKFKPALLDIKEVWFPDNHGDVGGGWPALDLKSPDKMGFFERIWHSLSTLKPKDLSKVELDDDRLQMSDMAIEWMIREVDLVGKRDPQSAVYWCLSVKEQFRKNMRDESKVREQVIEGFMHDCLSIGYDTALFKALMWKFMEILPFIPRWELNDTATKDKDQGWESYGGWPNLRTCRDIPRRAVLHNSLKERLEKVDNYKPKNNHGEGSSTSCLKASNGAVATMERHYRKNFDDENPKFADKTWDARHRTWQLSEVQE
ncbi:hypothetical protein NW762_006241 [Fusarium torreyae]|uniref:T6SS Phospholipase effector Tle1-like catalytic domain-containing protein n=1 Tax=Fusarium torreyae TaxID=1237075 RepID=A0A9W8VF05_9HYPO|nr:hypothetical protein NW762_006241 [Fusarium torreyae]